MTGARGKDGLQAARMRELLPQLGLDEDQLFALPAAPAALEESNLQVWSYAPEFTPLVQRLLQLRRGGGSFAVAVCGGAGAAARSAVAAQLAVGFTQHGLGTVLVDADPVEPGLGGLVRDPHQEGLVDMVRFGRSCRALLRAPFPGAPSLLGMGSFPVFGRMPFEGEAWRGIVHRIALHSEVALYVGPVQIEAGLHPLLQVVEQVIYVAGADGAEDDVERLRRSTARVAAVAACALAEPERDAGAGLASGTGLGAVAPPRPAAPAAEAAPSPRPEPAATLPELPEPEELGAMEPVPDDEEEAAATTPSPWSRKAAAELASLRAGSEDFEGVPERGDPTRPPEEAKELRQRLGVGETDFSYSHHGRYSRAPLYLFLLLVVSIGGFLGYAFYRSKQRPPASGTIDDAAAQAGASPGPQAAIDDAAAAGGGAAPRTAAPSPPTTAAQEPPPAVPPTQEPAASQPPPQEVAPQQAQPPPVAAAGGDTDYVVHVASYHKIEQANQDIANLRKLGYEARAVRTDLGSKGIWFRVYVGSYPSKAAAEQAREAILKLPGYDGFAQVRRAPAP